MSNFTQLTAQDGHIFDAFIYEPAIKSKGSIIFLHEIFGLNDFVKEICHEWAQKGYHTLAPALYDRLEKNLVLPYSSQGYEKALAYKQKILMVTNKNGISGWELQLYDIAAARNYLKTKSERIGIIGFSWGGTLGWLSACRLNDISYVTAYYGTHIHQFINEIPQCPVMLHCGEQDELLTLSQVKKIQTNHPKIAVHIYTNATHGFCCDAWQNQNGINQQFNQSAKELADQRTEIFINNFYAAN